eukprot:PhM_4_TR2858/c1_g1_i1/m.92820
MPTSSFLTASAAAVGHSSPTRQRSSTPPPPPDRDDALAVAADDDDEETGDSDRNVKKESRGNEEDDEVGINITGDVVVTRLLTALDNLMTRNVATPMQTTDDNKNTKTTFSDAGTDVVGFLGEPTGCDSNFMPQRQRDLKELHSRIARSVEAMAPYRAHTRRLALEGLRRRGAGAVDLHASSGHYDVDVVEAKDSSLSSVLLTPTHLAALHYYQRRWHAAARARRTPLWLDTFGCGVKHNNNMLKITAPMKTAPATTTRMKVGANRYSSPPLSPLRRGEGGGLCDMYYL